MLLEMSFRSEQLKEETKVNVILPSVRGCEEKEHKVLWLLHGLHGNHTSWMRQTSIERYATEKNLVVIMPGVDRSWYTDTAYGANYFTFITEELPDVCRRNIKGLRQEREHNIIAGLSMGGYGAVKAALTYPEKYFACISLSGSLDITRKGRVCDLPLWKSNFGFDLENPMELEGTKHDVFHLASAVREMGKVFPDFYLWCGTEDSLFSVNRAFSEHLSALGVTHKYEESEGNHSWKWWDLHIQSGLKYILDVK